MLLAAAAPDPVVAERGADQVTVSQARALIAVTDPDTRRKLAGDPTSVTELLRNYLLGRAVLEAARAQNWEQRPEVAALMQRARDSAIAQSFLAAQAAPPPTYPNEAEIQSAYEANKAQLLQPRSYHLSQLYLPIAATAPASAAEEASRKLAQLRQLLQRGHASFEAAGARMAGVRYADLGWLPENRLQPKARDAVSGLLDGQVGEPICTKAGCSLLKMVATRPAGPPPLADVRDGLIRALRQQKERQGEQAYANALLAHQPIRVNEIELGHLVTPQAK